MKHSAKILIGALHMVGWSLMLVAALSASSGSSTAITLGSGLVAYLLGLRHAFDLDHLSAIDNTTRKLLNDGKRTKNIGLFFALGHSTVVIGVSLMLVLGFWNLGSQLLTEHSPLHRLFVLIGTAVAALFLTWVAIANLGVLLQIGRQIKSVRSNQNFDPHREEQILSRRGAASRLLRPVFRLVDKPWKMYPVGFLFGLGLDTATSIALLATSGTTEIVQHNIAGVIALPLVFTAGMALGDSANSSLMTKIYTWSMDKPQRRLTVNFGTTCVSIAAAFTCAVPLAWSAGLQLLA